MLKNKKISGKSQDTNFFHYFSNEEINFLEILKVLKGEKLGCIFRNVVADSYINSIYANAFPYKELVHLKKREDRIDEAPHFAIGIQHYKKDLNIYLDEAERVLSKLNNLFNGIDSKNNFFNCFIKNFSKFLESHDIIMRLAEHKGRVASPFWIRSFDASKTFLIEPHDDAPQLRCPKQAGFEIQSVNPIIAVNICLENQNQGMLLHYNLQPDDEMRKFYGIEYTGYPYPLDILEKIEKIELETNRGDFYFLNANNIHAVKAPKVSKDLRTTMSWFMGFKDEKTLLYWI